MDRIPPLQIFLVFLRLGLTSFGGPVAHLGYFHRTLILDRRWLDEESYGELIGLCQFLPGPSSSQVGIGIGFARGGWPGAVAAWIGFTLPSAVLMTALGLGMRYFGSIIPPWLIHGLTLVAVPIVAQAVWLMARQLCPDWPRRLLAIAAAIILIAIQITFMPPLVIVGGGLFGFFLFANRSVQLPRAVSTNFRQRLAQFLLLLFFTLLFLLPVMSEVSGDHGLTVFSAFYRSGALVFGGGHVILPLLQASVVPSGWVTGRDFLAGYGAAQAMPGPLFSFAAYLGAVMTAPPTAVTGALLCLAAIYLPSFLLVIGALPIWQVIRHRQRIRGAVTGVNAVVVGILAAALYRSVFTTAVHSLTDTAVAIAGLVLLVALEIPSWTVVLLTVTAAGILSL